MALKLDLILDNGIQITDAYCKIIEYTHLRPIGQNESLRFTVAIFKDEDARLSQKPEVSQFIHTCSGDNVTIYFSEEVLNDDGKTVITQAYSWLKTLPMYSSAVDVVDTK